jgi:hypothetical protein
MTLKSEDEITAMAPSKLQGYFEDVAKEMAQYERVMRRNQFTSRGDFEARYSGLGGASHWRRHAPQQEVGGSVTARMSIGGAAVEPLDLSKAMPFIRAVIERMLDLLGDEEHWVKGTTHQNVDGIDKYCLIGAEAQALQDLTLSEHQDDPVVERQRQRVLAAVKKFMIEALKEEKGYSSMPSFNDNEQTSFEDVRLWLKGLLGRLED